MTLDFKVRCKIQSNQEDSLNLQFIKKNLKKSVTRRKKY
jgi:hypothetical protein